MEMPAVSVIIPLYNAEKYIGECLDSLLAQTFQNFEVIVVDDCSTDSSPSIVENYREKFGDRLIFIKRKKNFGGAAMSRNMGISLACGEYIQLLDNDDLLTKTALEELYTAAKESDADIVYTSARYIHKDGKDFIDLSESFTDEAHLEVNASESLLYRFFSRRGYIFWTPWTKFVKRTFLAENEIRFPEMSSHEDLIWTIDIFCCVKKFLLVPNAVYCWRESVDSITRSRRNSMEHLKFWVSIITTGIKYLDGLWSRYEILKKNPLWLYKAQNYLFEECFMRYAFNLRVKVSSETVYDTLLPQFANSAQKFSGSHIPYLYSRFDLMQKQLIALQHKFNDYAEQINKCIEDFEKAYRQNKAQLSEIKKLYFDSQRRIAELQEEVYRLKNKE